MPARTIVRTKEAQWWGIVKRGVIACPRHGWHYDLAKGASTDHPDYTLKTYQVEVVGDDIMIDV